MTRALYRALLHYKLPSGRISDAVYFASPVMKRKQTPMNENPTAPPESEPLWRDMSSAPKTGEVVMMALGNRDVPAGILRHYEDQFPTVSGRRRRHSGREKLGFIGALWTRATRRLSDRPTNSSWPAGRASSASPRPTRPVAKQGVSFWTSAKPTLLPFMIGNGPAHRDDPPNMARKSKSMAEITKQLPPPLYQNRPRPNEIPSKVRKEIEE